MFASHDMLDVMLELDDVLMHKAVLTTPLGPSPDEIAGFRIH